MSGPMGYIHTGVRFHIILFLPVSLTLSGLISLYKKPPFWLPFLAKNPLSFLFHHNEGPLLILGLWSETHPLLAPHALCKFTNWYGYMKTEWAEASPAWLLPHIAVWRADWSVKGNINLLSIYWGFTVRSLDLSVKTVVGLPVMEMGHEKGLTWNDENDYFECRTTISLYLTFHDGEEMKES